MLERRYQVSNIVVKLGVGRLCHAGMLCDLLRTDETFLLQIPLYAPVLAPRICKGRRV